MVKVWWVAVLDFNRNVYALMDGERVFLGTHEEALEQQRKVHAVPSYQLLTVVLARKTNGSFRWGVNIEQFQKRNVAALAILELPELPSEEPMSDNRQLSFL